MDAEVPDEERAIAHMDHGRSSTSGSVPYTDESNTKNGAS